MSLIGANALIRGIDLYDRNAIDSTYWVSQAIAFGYVKLSEGADIQHGAAARIDALRSIGAEVGGYAYGYLPREDQAQAADVFVSLVRSLGVDDLSPAVDLESLCSVSGTICAAPDEALRHCEELTDRIEQALSIECVVYTGAGFWTKLGAAGRASWLTQRRLWQADYNIPLLAPWTPAHDPPYVTPWGPPYVWQIRDRAPDGRGLDCNVTTAERLDAIRWRKEPRTVAREFSADQIQLSDAAIPPQPPQS